MKKNELEKFISHELFHHWLPHSMGQLEQEGQGLSWFVEGFTSYYSLILRYRMNYLNFEEYVMNVNEILYKLATSQLRRTNNKYLVDQFFNDPVASQTLYRRGFLIALKWDQKIRKTYEGKKSLDSVMNLLLTEFTLNPKLKLGEDIITKHMEKFGIIDAKGDIKEMLVGADILSDSDIYNECIELTKKDIEIYDLGFQFEETSTSFDFTSVDDKSQAYENGLRLGQMPMSVEISHGDMNSNVKLKVQDGKEIKEIIFRPFKKQSVPFLKFKNHMEEKSICDLNLLEAK